MTTRQAKSSDLTPSSSRSSSDSAPSMVGPCPLCLGTGRVPRIAWSVVLRTPNISTVVRLTSLRVDSRRLRRGLQALVGLASTVAAGWYTLTHVRGK